MIGVSKSVKFAVVLAVVMAMALTVTQSVFAAYPGAYGTSLYKSGTSLTELSMGDPAILNSDVSYGLDDLGDPETIITVYVTSMNVTMGGNTYTGYIDDGSIVYNGATYVGVPQPTGATHPTSLVFTIPGTVPVATIQAVATFILSIDGFASHPTATGDLVILYQ
jgi:hypothetical protein